MSSDLMSLNVGGDIFTTTVDTLRKEHGSMLDVMFSGLFAVERDDAGRIFIDRDGQRFRHILNYLRSSSVYVGPDLYSLQALLEEAEFYGISSLVVYLRQRLQEIHEASAAAEDLDSDASAGVNLSQSTDVSSTAEADAMAMQVIRTVIQKAQEQPHVGRAPAPISGSEPKGYGEMPVCSQTEENDVPLSQRDFNYVFTMDEDF